MTINLFRITLFSYSRVKKIGMTNTVPFYSPSKNVRKTNQPRLTFDDVYEILKCGHSNKSYWVLPSFGPTRYILLRGSNVWVFWPKITKVFYSYEIYSQIFQGCPWQWKVNPHENTWKRTRFSHKKCFCHAVFLSTINQYQPTAVFFLFLANVKIARL